MLDASEIQQLEKGWAITRAIWAVLLGSLGVYLVVGTLAVEQVKVAEENFPLETMRTVLSGVALVTIVFTAFIRKTMLRISGGNAVSVIDLRSIDQIQHPAAGKYLTAIVVAMALAESIGIYGLVLFFLSKDAMTFYFFIAMSAMAMMYYRPRKEELFELAEEMKKKQGGVREE